MKNSRSVPVEPLFRAIRLPLLPTGVRRRATRATATDTLAPDRGRIARHDRLPVREFRGERAPSAGEHQRRYILVPVNATKDGSHGFRLCFRRIL